jgi:hypothetical protein
MLPIVMKRLQINDPQKRLAVYILAAAGAGLGMAWLAAALLPGFLLYATPPFKADAVVLLLGTDESARRRQADDLITAGWAKYLIVPYEGEILETRVSRTLVTPQKTAAIARGVKIDYLRAYVQRTHLELLQTRELMAYIGTTRVIFVSSPYHMRRIKIIAGRVFEAGEHEMAYIPTIDDPPQIPWFFHWGDIQWVLSEWGKILWFFIYGPFV